MLTARVQDRSIEYRMVPGDAIGKPTLVFLHEGLGSVGLWRDFPDKVAHKLGTRALIYSRFGYGGSDGLLAKREPDFMHREALEVLPELLDQLSIDRPLLVGHSDGASIALIHAGASGRAVRGVAVMAPHVFVETVTLESIARIRATYLASGLRERLGKYHARVDDAFLGWADIWLDPRFAAWCIDDIMPAISVPILAIQGRQDEYGSMRQLDRIQALAKAPVTRLELDQCGHSPHRDQENACVEAIVDFVRRLP